MHFITSTFLSPLDVVAFLFFFSSLVCIKFQFPFILHWLLRHKGDFSNCALLAYYIDRWNLINDNDSNVGKVWLHFHILVGDLVLSFRLLPKHCRQMSTASKKKLSFFSLGSDANATLLHRSLPLSSLTST